MKEDIVDNMSRRLDEAIERGRHLVEDEDLALRAEELMEQAETTIRKYPLRSVAAGLLAGYVIGKLFSSDH